MGVADRERVIKAVEEAFDLVHSDFIGTDDFNETEWDQNKVDALSLLKKQETIMQCIKGKCRICPHCANCDVDENGFLKEQEVKTGKWIEQTDYLGDTYYDCSVCNESWITIEGTPWVNGMNYCPHCGAKMSFESR